MTSAAEPRSTPNPGFAARIAARTPADRDRSVDALRALAIGGVVLGHWLVTALVPGDHGVAVSSPLIQVPEFTPMSWVLQTLALFFLVGGYAAARGYRPDGSYAGWLRRRMVRLLRPVAGLVGAWAVVATAAVVAGAPTEPLRDLAKIAMSPLWFLAVFAVLTALTPAVVAAVRRFGTAVVLAPLTVVVAVDLARFTATGPMWLGWLNLVAGWLVPFSLGVAWARGGLTGRRTALGLLAAGALAAIALVVFGGYPASMVGVPGQGVSNLNPPTLAAVAFGVAQVGAALLLADPLRRAMRRPRAWAAVVVVNLSAMTVFLWHQTALVVVTAAAAGFGRFAGLHDLPAEPGWVPHRLVWLPVFAAALVTLAAIGAVAARARQGMPLRRTPPRGDRSARRSAERLSVAAAQGTLERTRVA